MTSLEQPVSPDYEDWFLSDDTILLDAPEEVPPGPAISMRKLVGVGAVCAMLASATAILF